MNKFKISVAALAVSAFPFVASAQSIEIEPDSIAVSLSAVLTPLELPVGFGSVDCSNAGGQINEDSCNVDLGGFESGSTVTHISVAAAAGANAAASSASFSNANVDATAANSGAGDLDASTQDLLVPGGSDYTSSITFD